MYLPKSFLCEDPSVINALIGDYPLATVVSVVDGSPEVSHLPLISVANRETGLTLMGHMSRANGHWKNITASEVTVMFHGPQGYITPKWYVEHDVPTWNYAVVHCRGVVKLIEDAEGIGNCLRQLTEKMESRDSAPWTFWLSPDLSDPKALCAAIVGFEIKVTDLRAKIKMGQNRSASDLEGVARGLAARGDDMSMAVRELVISMKK